MGYEANAEQRACLDDVMNGRGHVVWRARAGVGKTATLIEALRYIPRDEDGVPLEKTIMVAFASDTAKTLERKVPEGVEVKTLHGLGLRALGKAFGSVTVQKGKCRDIAMRVSGADLDARKRPWGFALDKVVSRAKNTLALTPDQIDALIDDMQLEHPEPPRVMQRCAVCQRWSPEDAMNPRCGHNGCQGEMVRAVRDDRPEFIRQVIECMERSTYDLVDGQKVEPRTVDFDCMIYLPYALQLRMPKYGRVFVDETQDLNALQIWLSLSIVTVDGRITAVGDDRQGIYGFRGAAKGALDRVVASLKARVMPMTMTYRCGTVIVREAQKLVPDIQAAPGMHEGSVEDYVSKDRMMREARPGDFILSRTNAPLLGICLEFLREGTKAHILGRDIGERLAAILRKAKTNDVGKLAEWVKQWADKEVERLEKKGESGNGVRDQHECLVVLMEGVRDTAAVIERITRLFDDGKDVDRITLSTTHKAKGMERDRVWMLRDTFWGAGKGNIEEDNLLYVATTRAKHALYYVRTPRRQ